MFSGVDMLREHVLEKPEVGSKPHLEGHMLILASYGLEVETPWGPGSCQG